MMPTLHQNVGDLVGAGNLAWKVYKSYKDVPESFHGISSDALSLYAILKEAEEKISSRPLPQEQREWFKVVRDGCHEVLEDIDKLIKQYEGMGSHGKLTWDRMRWETENIAELRTRLSLKTQLLTAWIR